MPRLRRTAAPAPRTVRHVPGMLGLSRLPIHARPERRGGGRGTARARRPRPRAPGVRTRGGRLRAGGRDLGRMSDPLAASLKYLTLERDASPHTLRSYRSDLREFQVFVGRDKPLGEVDGRTVRAYLAHLHTRGLDGASVARKLAALRSWFRFLVRRGKLARNVARAVRGPRPGRPPGPFRPIAEAQVLVDGQAV